MYDNKLVELLEKINSMCYKDEGENAIDKDWQKVSDLICEALPEARVLQERVNQLNDISNKLERVIDILCQLR